MNNNDDISEAVSLLKKTLPEMNKRNIATTPENYAVWYEYVNGKNGALVNAIDALDEGKSVFSNEVHQDLYNKYIASIHESAVSQLSDSVKEIIHDLLGKMSTEGLGLNQYAETLSNFSQQVESVNSINDIKHLIGELLEETRKREGATQSMQNSLESMATEMKKLRAEVSRLNSEATTDSLTKVNNRRAFDLEIDNFVSTSKMENTPLCMLLLDIDHFKSFNDKYGHIIGDKVLKFVATLLKKNIKGGDSVSRYGGEEFAILLPETEYGGALSVAEHIRTRLAKQTLSDSAEKIQLGTITVSIGVSSYQYGEVAEDMIRRADQCMYQAKKIGRNRVIGEQEFTLSETGSETFI